MQELLLLLGHPCSTAFTKGRKNWDKVGIYRRYRWCRVREREADELEKKKSLGRNKSGEEMEPEKKKAEGIYESVCLNLPARLPVSESVLNSYVC